MLLERLAFFKSFMLIGYLVPICRYVKKVSVATICMSVLYSIVEKIESPAPTRPKAEENYDELLFLYILSLCSGMVQLLSNRRKTESSQNFLGEIFVF